MLLYAEQRTSPRAVWQARLMGSREKAADYYEHKSSKHDDLIAPHLGTQPCHNLDYGYGRDTPHKTHN